MCDVTKENSQAGADTPQVRSDGGRPQSCPSWCVDHDWTDIGHHDEAVTHLGPVRETRGPWDQRIADVQLSQVEFVNEGVREPVVVRIDDDILSPTEAARDAMELAAILAEVAGVAG